ncbi:3',5'-cyclic-AMP phosphodiesterase [Colwellia asteriadis]|uniref:3',5'-cyclic-AMP phosphodiesterase n=1 Tax=Colwellia asteriadis TaxID=517723 RepID=A0ABN1L2Q4_9GAMM
MLSSKSPLTIAQISDCHLFSSISGLHHGVNVYQNLLRVLTDIAQNSAVEAIFFTGDLTQDHSEASYQNFVKAIKSACIRVPVYYLAGNHDEVALLDKYLVEQQRVTDNINQKGNERVFKAAKTVTLRGWQVQLLHSKSETPAGWVNQTEFQRLATVNNANKKQLVMMHHHPIDVGYFIDKHGLLNQDEFWLEVRKIPNIAAIACGHVHRASKASAVKVFEQNESAQYVPSVDVYTCPATSIQFDPKSSTVKALAQGPGYRLFYLAENGTLNSDVVWLEQMT